MKRTLSLLLAMLLCIALNVGAEETSAVFVSISDGTGALVLAYASVVLTDADEDGALTVSDALLLSHIAHHEKGAEAYGAEKSQYGLSLVRLWGDDSGAFGYCVNNGMAMSLADAVKPGDHIKAYVYTDLETWSDAYSFFNSATVAAAVNAEVALTLTANGFDENWNPITLPVEGAFLTVNGEKTDMKTDEQGKVVLTFPQAGTYTVSAVGENLVPPVCIVTVK